MVAIAREYAAEERGLSPSYSALVQDFRRACCPALRSSHLSSLALRERDESEAGGLSPFDGTEDMSLWDPFFGFVFRALSDGGVRYNRYHADNARYENWLRGQFPADPGLGNPGASRSFAMARADRGPAVRKSHDARYGWWGEDQNEIQVFYPEELSERDAMDILVGAGVAHIPEVGIIPVKLDLNNLEPITGIPELVGPGKILVAIKASRFGQWVGRIFRGNQAARNTPTPSDSQIRHFQRQLQEDGPRALQRSERRLQRRLEQHRRDLEKYRREGGRTSSVEREIRNYERELEAIRRVQSGR